MTMSKVLTDLINKVYSYNTLSIIGLEKNTGKTTTLNFLIRTLKNITLGITSIGMDGEDKDTIYGTNKPKIYIDKGTLVASAKTSLLLSDVTFEILEVLDINTPLGSIIIAKSVSPGFAQISGASTKNGTKKVICAMEKYGANLSLVDGALSRKTFADPLITDASILCIGAAFSENTNTLVNETLKLICFYSLPEAEDKTKELYKNNMEQARLLFVYKNKIIKSKAKTNLGSSKEIISNFSDDLRYVFIKGAITNSLFIDILNSQFNVSNVIFIIEDGTKLFLDMGSYSRFLDKGGQFQCLKKINIIGISINPKSISGYSLDYKAIESRLKRSINIPVFNVLNQQ